MPLAAQMQKDAVDLDAVYRIKREAINDSQVMDALSYISDVYGGRLTGSPNAKTRFGDWVLKQMKDWGNRKSALRILEFRPRLGQRAFLRQRNFARHLSAHRVSARVDARHSKARSQAQSF